MCVRLMHERDATTRSEEAGKPVRGEVIIEEWVCQPVMAEARRLCWHDCHPFWPREKVGGFHSFLGAFLVSARCAAAPLQGKVKADLGVHGPHCSLLQHT